MGSLSIVQCFKSARMRRIRSSSSYEKRTVEMNVRTEKIFGEVSEDTPVYWSNPVPLMMLCCCCYASVVSYAKFLYFPGRGGDGEVKFSLFFITDGRGYNKAWRRKMLVTSICSSWNMSLRNNIIKSEYKPDGWCQVWVRYTVGKFSGILGNPAILGSSSVIFGNLLFMYDDWNFR